MRTRFTGIKAWWIQRASAAYIFAFMLLALGTLWRHPATAYRDWRGWFEQPGVSAATLAFFAALLAHMWVGLRDVLLDYGRPAGLRRFLLGFVAVALAGLAAWALRILLPFLT